MFISTFRYTHNRNVYGCFDTAMVKVWVNLGKQIYLVKVRERLRSWLKEKVTLAAIRKKDLNSSVW